MQMSKMTPSLKKRRQAKIGGFLELAGLRSEGVSRLGDCGPSAWNKRVSASSVTLALAAGAWHFILRARCGDSGITLLCGASTAAPFHREQIRSPALHPDPRCAIRTQGSVADQSSTGAAGEIRAVLRRLP